MVQHTYVGVDAVAVGRILGEELDKRLGPERVAEAQAAFDKGKQEAEEAAKPVLEARDLKSGKLEAQLAAKEAVPVGATPEALAAVILFNMGFEAQKAHRREEAVGLYAASILLDPTRPTGYYNRGVAKYDLGDKAGAIQDFDKAIELNPKDAAAYNNRGNAKSDLGDQAGAIPDYDKAIELDPKYARAYYNKARACAKANKNEMAVRNLETAIDLDRKYHEIARACADFDSIRDYPAFKRLME